MNIFNVLISTIFIILGVVAWIIAMLIIIVGAFGVLRVAIKEVFELDILTNIKNIHLANFLKKHVEVKDEHI